MLRSCALLAIGAASAFAMDRLSMESDVAPATARFWTAVGPSDPTTQLKFTIAMRVEKAAAAKLERVFHEVSDPKNPMYGTPTSQLPISMLRPLINWLLSLVVCTSFCCYLLHCPLSC